MLIVGGDDIASVTATQAPSTEYGGVFTMSTYSNAAAFLEDTNFPEATAAVHRFCLGDKSRAQSGAQVKGTQYLVCLDTTYAGPFWPLLPSSLPSLTANPVPCSL